MAEDNNRTTAPPDFVSAWRDWLGTTEQQWNEFLGQAMGTEEFAAGLGQNLDVFLHIQRVMNETMGSYLTTLNVPTRTDVLELGERLVGIDARIAALEAQLSQVLHALGELAAARGDAPPARPARTRRPPTDSAAETSQPNP